MTKAGPGRDMYGELHEIPTLCARPRLASPSVHKGWGTISVVGKANLTCLARAVWATRPITHLPNYVFTKFALCHLDRRRRSAATEWKWRDLEDDSGRDADSGSSRPDLVNQ
jgi:hypothetical protein